MTSKDSDPRIGCCVSFDHNAHTCRRTCTLDLFACISFLFCYDGARGIQSTRCCLGDHEQLDIELTYRSHFDNSLVTTSLSLFSAHTHTNTYTNVLSPLVLTNKYKLTVPSPSPIP